MKTTLLITALALLLPCCVGAQQGARPGGPAPAVTRAASADCFDSAATYHGVNSLVLRAIAWHESRMQAQALRRNSNGSFDIGLTQINSVHMPALALYGIEPGHLLNGCVSAFVGAWHLRQKMQRHGNTWAAVGAYHSETPQLRDRYALAIHAIVMDWSCTDAGGHGPAAAVPRALAPHCR